MPARGLAAGSAGSRLGGGAAGAAASRSASAAGAGAVPVSAGWGAGSGATGAARARAAGSAGTVSGGGAGAASAPAAVIRGGVRRRRPRVLSSATSSAGLLGGGIGGFGRRVGVVGRRLVAAGIALGRPAWAAPPCSMRRRTAPPPPGSRRSARAGRRRRADRQRRRTCRGSTPTSSVPRSGGFHGRYSKRWSQRTSHHSPDCRSTARAKRGREKRKECQTRGDALERGAPCRSRPPGRNCPAPAVGAGCGLSVRLPAAGRFL